MQQFTEIERERERGRKKAIILLWDVSPVAFIQSDKIRKYKKKVRSAHSAQ